VFKILLLIASFLLAQFLYAQEPYYINYTTDDGLPNNTTYLGIQDEDGFMWIATDGGLCKYDGNKFEVVVDKNGIGDDFVINFLIDKQGYVWYVNLDRELKYFHKDTLPYNIVNTNHKVNQFGIAEFQNSIITSGNYQVFILKKNSINSVTLEESTIYGVCANDNDYHTLTRTMLYRLDKLGIKNSIPTGVNDSAIVVQKLSCSKNNIYELRNNKLLVVKANSLLEVFSADQNVLFFSLKQKDKNLFLSTSNGIYILDAKTFALKRIILNGKYILSATFDKNDNLWVFSNSEGVFLIPNYIVTTKSPAWLQNKELLDLQKTENSLFIGSQSDNLIEYKNEEFQNHLIENSGLGLRSFDYINPHIFIPKKGGIVKFNVNKKSFTTLLISGAKGITTYQEDVYIIAYWGLGSYSNSEYKKLVPGRGYAIATFNNKIWVGTLKGLYSYDPNDSSVQSYNQFGIDTTDHVNFLKNQNDSILWISTTTKGVFGLKYTAEAYEKITIPISTLANDIHFENGNLYVATNNGLITINKNGEQTTLNKLNGLPSDKANAVTIYDDKLYVTTSKGLTKIELNELQKSKLAIPNLITGFLINGNSHNINDQSKLKYNQNNITIKFSSLNFEQGDKQQFKYKLHSIDTFTYTNSTTLNFPNVNPGDYDFELWTLGSNQQWLKTPSTLSFKIKPPFNKTIWFWLLIILGAILLAYYIFRNRLVQAKNAEDLKELELQALRAQMNPHFIFNALTAIQDLIAKHKEVEAQTYLTKFSRLIRKVLDQSGRKLITIAEEVDTLKLYTLLEELRFKDKFDTTITVDENLDVSFEKIPPMVLQPFVENAINHGLKNKKDKGKLTISLKQVNQQLLATIVDDGIGRIASEKLKAEKSQHKSKGLAITQKRIHLLGENDQYSVKIIDLTDYNGQAIGTQVEVLLDLK